MIKKWLRSNSRILVPDDHLIAKLASRRFHLIKGQLANFPLLLGQIFALTQPTVLNFFYSSNLLPPFMHPSQRDPRPSYSYDDQSTAYTGHVSHHSGEYTPTGYQQYDGTHYYAAPTHTMGGDNNCMLTLHDLFFVLTDQPCRH